MTAIYVHQIFTYTNHKLLDNTYRRFGKMIILETYNKEASRPEKSSHESSHKSSHESGRCLIWGGPSPQTHGQDPLPVASRRGQRQEFSSDPPLPLWPTLTIMMQFYHRDHSYHCDLVPCISMCPFIWNRTFLNFVGLSLTLLLYIRWADRPPWGSVLSNLNNIWASKDCSGYCMDHLNKET
jgi:hypothetical protein